ncbi:MAG: hypothetical protein UY42_C0006G0008 [Parcubacteria group bacterium GW2011_GWA2_49_16]|nr:MAG: hypothetical protein UY42_C0006G0008 [Parcubacteria group bacterium GW2011_GWA2_49_16]
MNARRLVGIGFIIGIAALFAGALYVKQASRVPVREGEQGAKISIVTSFYPLAYVATSVGGSAVLVTNLTQEGSEPHDFDPLPRDMIAIGKADVFIWNGGGLEPWIMKWQQGGFTRPRKTIEMISTLIERGNIPLDISEDPHVWLDPLIMEKEVEIVRDALIEIDPGHGELYTENATRAMSLLIDLDTKFREGLAECARRDIIVSHQAFGYLGNAYGLHITSIAGIAPDEEPSSKELARIVEVVRRRGVTHIFFEPTASPKFSETIAREVGAQTLVLDPIESPSREAIQAGEDYISLMMNNLNNLRKALSCR